MKERKKYELKKIKRCLAVLVIVLSLFSVTAQGGDEDIQSKIERLTGAGRLHVLLPESIYENEETSSFDVTDITSEDGAKNIFSLILSVISKEIKNNGKLLAGLCAVLIFSAVISATGILSGGDSEIFRMICTMVLCISCCDIILELISATEKYLSDLNMLITGMLPVMTSVYTLNGQVTSGGIQSACIILGLDILQGIFAYLLMPGVRICFALLIAGVFSPISLDGIHKSVKNTITGITLISMTIMSAVLYFQTVVSASADTVLIRTARYAAGTFIPIVGSMVSEAVKTVSAGIGAVKSLTGAFGVGAVIYISAFPVLGIVVKKLIFSFSASASSVLNCKREETVLREFCSVADMLLAFCAASAVFFLIALTVFMREFYA